MEQYADEFERQCAALRSRLATEENKSRHLEAERDALREAVIQIDHHASQNRVWAGVDGWKYAGLSNVAQKKIHGITQAALAATEVKP